jgi:hypothetical protein
MQSWSALAAADEKRRDISAMHQPKTTLKLRKNSFYPDKYHKCVGAATVILPMNSKR